MDYCPFENQPHYYHQQLYPHHFHKWPFIYDISSILTTPKDKDDPKNEYDL